MNSNMLKARSRQSISWAKPPVWMISAAYALLGLGASYIVSPYTALEGAASIAEVMQILVGFVQRYWMLLSLWLALRVLLLVADAGYAKYCLNISRNTKAGIGTLFELVPQSARYIGLGLLIMLAVCIPMLVLVPAVIFAFAAKSVGVLIALLLAAVLAIVATLYIELGLYMSTLVAIDNPGMGIIGCMRESWGLMKGRRLDFLTLRLSFFGWALLLALIGTAPGMLAYMIFYTAYSVWLTPYIQVTCANYYNLIISRLPVRNQPPQESGLPAEENRPPLDEDMWKK